MIILFILGCFFVIFLLVFLVIPRITRHTSYGDLHPQTALVILLRKLTGGEKLNTNIEQYRTNLFSNIKLLEGRKPPMASIIEETVLADGVLITLRVYTPTKDELLPAMLYCHGGGFVCGGINSVDTICRNLAASCKAIVCSIEYPLAPEHPFPAALESSYAALCWLAENCGRYGADATRIVVAGESAGANLAAAVSLLSIQRKGPKPVAQLLLYPWLDLADTSSDSFTKYSQDFLLSTEEILWFRSLYEPDAEKWSQPLVSPLHASDCVGLPPALIVACEFDVLRDQSSAYYEKLKASAVSSDFILLKGLTHGGLSMTRWAPAYLASYYKEIGERLNKLF